jgi:uncharacterized membrane protein YebE (DUF533 family)
MVDTVKILGALLGGGKMSSGGSSEILKSIIGAAMGSRNGGGLEDLLGSVLGGSGASQKFGGGLGDILGSVLGGDQGQSSSGGLGDILGSVLGGAKPQANAQSGGGLGDILSGELGAGKGSSSASSGGGSNLEDLIGAALNQFGQSEKATQDNSTPRNFEEVNPGMVHSDACDQATLLIRAMVNAAKSDGRLDDQEQAKITGNLGTVTQDEIEFVNSEMAKPLDADGFARSVPSGLANQVYAMSLTAIDLDSNPEAQYLHKLAQGVNIDRNTIDQIHNQLGAPSLYG